MPRPHGNGARLSHYQFGATTMFASRADQRCSYCLYVPESYDEVGGGDHPLVVVVHGTEREAQKHRDVFIEFAERHDAFVLAPLFPAGIDEPGELNNYKLLEYGSMRFDRILLDMVEEVRETYLVDTDRFLITGFSGGGHFAHRMLYTHPDRLLGVTVGAPGVVTLLDERRAWPAGVGGMQTVLGERLDLEAIARVPVQLLIGGDDIETWELETPRGAPTWIEGVNDVGVGRQTRMLALRESLEAHGVQVRHDVVPGIAHEGYPLYHRVEEFFADVLATSASADGPGHDQVGGVSRA